MSCLYTTCSSGYVIGAICYAIMPMYRSLISLVVVSPHGYKVLAKTMLKLCARTALWHIHYATA